MPFARAGRRIVGPTAKAAQLEGSKVFAKQFMEKAGIPTAKFKVVDSAEEARKALNGFSFPVVLKADGLAAGKGVIIVKGASEVSSALERLPTGRIVVEECLVGEEVSFIVLCDGKKAIPFETTQDHKAVLEW